LLKKYAATAEEPASLPRGVCAERDPGPNWKILTHLGEPLEPPPVSPVRGPPTAWGELLQIYDDRAIFQAFPEELPAIDIHSL